MRSKNHSALSKKIGSPKRQKAVELAIKELIEADARLKELFDLMISVPGIGPVIATELLVATAGRPRNEMQTINDPKKLAASAVRLSRRGCSLRRGRPSGTVQERVYGVKPK